MFTNDLHKVGITSYNENQTPINYNFRNYIQTIDINTSSLNVGGSMDSGEFVDSIDNTHKLVIEKQLKH